MRSFIGIDLKYHNKFYLFLLICVVVFLPHSRYLTSMTLIGMAAHWIAEGDFKRKFKVLKSNRALLIFISIFLLHLLSLLYSSNLDYGLKDLRIKLPLLSLPLIIGTSAVLSFKEIKLIFSFLFASLFVKTLYGIVLIYGTGSIHDYDLSVLAGAFSHIRYSLMLNIAVFSALFFSLISNVNASKGEKLLFFLLAAWFALFIFILKSLTGIVVFVFLLSIFFIFISKFISGKKLRMIFFSAISVFYLIVFLYGFWAINKYCTTDKIDFAKLEKYTSKNNPYTHFIDSKSRENGHFENIYICHMELQEEWNKISSIKFHEKDKKNQPISRTLIRYMTSLNLRKDAEGVRKLSQFDIKNIENGLTNHIFVRKMSLYNKLYVAFWEIEHYFNGGSPEGHSITQRIEFAKIAADIISDNFVFGVGVGDVNDEFQKKYELTKSKLGQKYRLRTHNQYLTFFVTFGIIGFLYFIFVLIFVPYYRNKSKDYLFLFIYIAFLLSMLNEDTLETQIGLTMFSYFVSLALFSYPETLSEDRN